MKLVMAQVSVTPSVDDNKACVLDILKNVSAGEWVVFPEGVISGYAPADPGYTRRLDSAVIEDAIAEIDDVAREVGCHVILGSAVRDEAGWRNSVIPLHPEGPGSRYHKIELSALDRDHFVAGRGVAVQTSNGVSFGALACREILFPHYWGQLKAQGAQIVFHLNNAIQPKDSRWDALLVARALENGFFVCSVNNSQPPQSLPSYLIAPSGRVVAATALRCQQVVSHEIDLSSVIADLSARTDY